MRNLFGRNCQTVIKDIFFGKTGSQIDGSKELLNQIEIENYRLAKARKLLLDDAIDSNDYKIIKAECENKLLSLEAKLTGFSEKSYDLNDCIDKALINLSRLQIAYSEGNTTVKPSIIGSIYPEKLCFDGTGYRTAQINAAAQLIYLINSQLGAKKIGQNLIFQACPIR
jgi:site-specific DNA recombinase